MDPFMGEIRRFPFGAIPDGWLPCDGRLLPIATNNQLYALIGPTFGGDAQTTFALPDLRGRIPVHQGGTSGPYGTVGAGSGGPWTNYVAVIYAISVAGTWPPRQQ